jgi:hypothetical protein
VHNTGNQLRREDCTHDFEQRLETHKGCHIHASFLTRLASGL